MIKIQALEQAQEEALAQLMCELWPESTLEGELTYLRSIRQSNVDAFFLLIENDDPEGFIQLKVRTDYVEGATSSPIAYVEGIYIRSALRRKGLGAQLIQKGEAWAKEKGLSQLASDAEIKNLSSIDFHKQVGFEEANRIVCFIKELD